MATCRCPAALAALAPFFYCNAAEQRCAMVCELMDGPESAALCNHFNVSQEAGVPLGAPVEDGKAEWACIKRGTVSATLEACFDRCAGGRCVGAPSPWFWLATVVAACAGALLVGGALYFAFRARLAVAAAEGEKNKFDRPQGTPSAP